VFDQYGLALVIHDQDVLKADAIAGVVDDTHDLGAAGPLGLERLIVRLQANRLAHVETHAIIADLGQDGLTVLFKGAGGRLGLACRRRGGQRLDSRGAGQKGGRDQDCAHGGSIGLRRTGFQLTLPGHGRAHRRTLRDTPKLRPGWVKASSVAGRAPTAGLFRPRTSLHQAYFSSKTLKAPARRVARSVTFQKAVTSSRVKRSPGQHRPPPHSWFDLRSDQVTVALPPQTPEGAA